MHELSSFKPLWAEELELDPARLQSEFVGFLSGYNQSAGDAPTANETEFLAILKDPRLVGENVSASFKILRPGDLPVSSSYSSSPRISSALREHGTFSLPKDSSSSSSSSSFLPPSFLGAPELGSTPSPNSDLRSLSTSSNASLLKRKTEGGDDTSAPSLPHKKERKAQATALQEEVRKLIDEVYPPKGAELRSRRLYLRRVNTAEHSVLEQMKEELSKQIKPVTPGMG